MIGGLSPGRI